MLRLGQRMQGGFDLAGIVAPSASSTSALCEPHETVGLTSQSFPSPNLQTIVCGLASCFMASCWGGMRKLHKAGIVVRLLVLGVLL